MSAKDSSEFDRRLLEARQIFIGEPINDRVAQLAIAKMLFLETTDRRTPLTLLINSPGGSIAASMAVFETIEAVQCPVHSIVMGTASGCALWLLAAGKRGCRRVEAKSNLSIEVTVPGSNAPFDASSKLWELNRKIAKKLADKSDLSETDVLYALGTGRRFTPTEAVSVGIADAVIEPLKIG